ADVSNVKVLNEAHTAHSSMLSGSGFSKSLTNEAPPPPPPQVAPQPSPAASQAEQQEASEGRNRTATNESPKALGTLTWGDAITKVQPQYPANAARVNASGPVDVKITISTTGRVIEAKALSGHLLLRNAAIEAAKLWVFKPAILNGLPVKAEIILTFV